MRSDDSSYDSSTIVDKSSYEGSGEYSEDFLLDTTKAHTVFNN